MRKIVNHPKMIDKTGQTFGRLTVLYRDHKRFNPVRWICRCVCGNIRSVRSDSLGKYTKSCGCYRKEFATLKKKGLDGRYLKEGASEP